MDDQQFFKETTDRNVLAQIIERYLPFWPLFVLTTLISLLVSYVYLRSQIPIYVASAKVLLKDPNKGAGDSKILDALNIFGDKKIVENEIVVLKSTNLMQQVVKDLDLYASVYNEGKVRTEELYKGNSPVWFRTYHPETIVPSGKYYFSVDWARNLINIDGKAVHFNDSVLINNTIYRVESNTQYLKNLKGKNYYVEFNSIEGAAGGLIGSLNATPLSAQSTVIDIHLEIPVPEKGVEVLTKLISEYNYTAIEDKNQIAAKTLRFIEDRLNGVITQLDSVERNVENYKRKNQVINLSAQADLYLSNVKDLDKSKSEIEIQLGVLNDVSNYIRNKNKRQGTVPALSMINDPTLSGLVGKLYDAEFQLEKSRSIAGEKSDAVVLADDQVNRLQADIRENINNLRSNLLSVRRNITTNIGANSDLLQQIPQKERGLIDISRQQAVKNNIYSYLLQKREETAINSASTIADLRIIEKAAYFGPVKPVPRNFYLVGLIVGVFIGVFIVLVREQFNRKVLFRAEIELKTKAPVVGEIIQINDNKDPVVIREGKRTVIAEQFRSLRTNLSFMALSEDAKTTLITSNISGEGKSFISINLAISYTLTDKKVALLELDLRKPRLSVLLKVSRDPGISNYLVGKIPIEQIIKETSIKNLFIVSAGAIPPNPSELIMSSKFKEMIAELKSRFDYLIIDSAPIGPVSDSLLLKAYADTTIFVVRHNATPKNYLKQIESLYQRKIFKNICVVFNGLKRRGFGGSSGYGYGNYGYGNYGYGYGNNGGGYYVKDERKSFFSRVKKFFRK